ncbi:MAG TPA: hypothetical protein V6C89_11515 [Drouetiella sp.]
MAKQNFPKNLVKNRLATVELALSKLSADYEETTYRKSAVVADCIKNAREELDAAFEKLFEDEYQRAFELAGIAWLHTDFGRQIIDAEAIEHILGESDYLELGDIGISWQEKARQHFAFLEQELQRVRAEITASRGMTN